MPISPTPVFPSQTNRTAAGKVSTHGGEGDLGAFNLRDTLSGIVVREANFGEFLAALKNFGAQAVKH